MRIFAASLSIPLTKWDERKGDLQDAALSTAAAAANRVFILRADAFVGKRLTPKQVTRL